MAYGDIIQYAGKAIWITAAGVDSDQTVTGAFTQLSRITDNGWNVNYPVVENAYLDSSVEAFDPTPASVDVSLVWWHTNAINERAIGLADLGVSGVMGFNLDQEKNLYVEVENGLGTDAIGASGVAQTKSVIALGHALLTAYDLSAEIGGLVQSRASFNCLSAFVYTGASGNAVPTISYQNGAQSSNQFALPVPQGLYIPTSDDPTVDVAAISARDMILSFPYNSPFAVVFTGNGTSYLQSFNLSLSLDRREVKPLGYVYPRDRSVFYPIHVELTAEAIVNRYQADQLDRLNCGGNHEVHLHVKQPCSNLTMFGFYLSNLQLESQSFNGSIGPFDTVSMKWRGLISNPNTMLFDPTFNALVNLADGSPWGTSW